MGRPNKTEYSEKEHKADVEALLAAGKKLKAISSEKRISLPSLRKAFPDEARKEAGTGGKKKAIPSHVQRVLDSGDSDAMASLDQFAQSLYDGIEEKQLRARLAEIEARKKARQPKK